MSPRPLTDEQLAFFDREGYLMIPDVFAERDLQPVVDELVHEVTKRAQALVDKGELSSTFENEGFEHQLTRISAETDRVATAVWNGVLNGPAIFDLICHPRLLDIAEQMLGEELVASSVYRTRPKIPGHIMGPVPWHQDSGYFEPACDKALVLTVWLPLVNATQERGCLWVVPRAHRGELLRHVVYRGKPYLRIEDKELPPGDEHKPTCVPVPKGGILLLDNRTPHASFDNTTDVTRWSMDLRYQNAALPTNAPITRLPGESMPTADGTIPGACYPPEADFLVRSKKRPDQVVTSAEQFRRLRESHKPGGISRKWDVVEPALA